MKNSDLIFGLIASTGKPEYSYSDIEWLSKPFNVSENCLRTSLFRMVSRDILESRKNGRNTYYKIGKRGQRIGSNMSFSFRGSDWSGWDGSWTGVLFSVPNIDNSARYRIRRKLTVYRYAPLYSGVWVRPENKNENLENNLKDILKSKHCSIIKFKYLNGISKEEVISLWKLNKINKILDSGLKIINSKSKNLTLLSPEKVFIYYIITGGELVDILFQDPLLPDEFLPENWKGKELRNKFTVWSNAVSEISKPYWGRIIS
jgi:phenylacetic acid degradation operon negative regulatory protein